MHIKGSVAIITGGARGLGKAFSDALLFRGGKVCFADVNEKEGKLTEESFIKTYGANSALFVKCDVTNDSEFKEAFKAARAKFKKVDIVVNNAGILHERLWEKTVDINLTGMMRGTLLAIEHMRNDKGGTGGTVINVSSSAGIYPTFFMPAYTASKFGVVGFTRSLADNLRCKALGLKFACLCPAFTDTDMLNDTLHSEDPSLLFWDDTKDIIMKIIKKTGVNRVDAVVRVFLDLVEKDDCNGDIVTIDNTRGAIYHNKRQMNKL